MQNKDRQTVALTVSITCSFAGLGWRTSDTDDNGRLLGIYVVLGYCRIPF